MEKLWPVDGKGTLPFGLSISISAFCGKQPLKVGPERLSTSATLVAQVVPARQSELVVHISVHRPRLQEPRSQSLSAVQVAPGAAVPRLAMQTGRSRVVGSGLISPTGLM